MIKQGIYKHYKGMLYQVIGVSRHSETLEEMVVYQALYDGYGLWVRPLDMFMGTLEIDGQEVQRFKFISESMSKSPQVS